MFNSKNRAPLACLATLATASLLAGCDDSPGPAPAPSAAVTATAPPSQIATPVGKRQLEPMAGGGVRLDMRGRGRHVRGLQRQPDGTFKTVCVDAPDALSPRSGGGGGGR